MRDEPPRLGPIRELGARLGQTFIKLDRILLHLDVATRSLADVKQSIQSYWSTFNDRPEQWCSGLLDWEQRLLAEAVRPGESRAVMLGRFAGHLWRTDWELADGDEIVRAQPAFRVFHYQHVFASHELAAEARDAGFTVLARFPPEAVVLSQDAR